MYTQRSGNNLGGCLVGMGFGMIIGLFVGIAATLGISGLTGQYLIDRVNGDAPELVAATPVPTPLSAIDGAAEGRRLVWNSPIPLDSDTREPELLVVSRNYDRSRDSILRFSPDEQQVIWESAPIDENGSSWVVAFDDERVYVATEMRLLALSREDGGLLWEAQLSDSIQASICQNCLIAINGSIVALSQDGVLQVFAGADGTQRWNRRMREASRQLVRLDDLIGLPDALPDQSSSAALYLFNPENGDPAGEVAPLCVRSDTGWDDRPHYIDPIINGPDGALYWYLDSANCLMRLEPGAREASRWAQLPENVRFEDDYFIFGDQSLFAASGDTIFVVNANGDTRILISHEDYQLTPISASAEVLLLEAQRTRGSSRSELWLVDPANGVLRSAIILQADTRVEMPRGSGYWIAEITDAGVVLLEVREDDEQMIYRVLDPLTGTDLVDLALAVEEPDTLLRGTVWTRETLFLSADELYAVTLSDGTIRYRWP